MKLRMISLAELAEVCAGGGAPQEPDAFSPDGFPFIRAGSLPKLLAGSSEASLERLTPKVAEANGLKLFPPGTVLFAKSGMSATKGHIYRLRESAYVVNHLAALLPRDPQGGPFLVRLLQRFSPIRLIRDSAYPSIRLSDIECMEVPVPVEQGERLRIAEVLDQAEALRDKRRAALAQLDTLTQATFFEMFGDPIANPNGFPISAMAELIDPRRPISYGILMPGPDQKAGVQYVRVVDMKDGGIEMSGIRKTTPSIAHEFRRSQLKPGDLLMSIRGHVGRFAVVPPELDGGNITQDTARLAVVGASPVFIRECLRSEAFQRWMKKHTKGVAVRGINLGDVKLMPIILPPKASQEKFSREAQTIGRLRLKQRAVLTELDALFASLQHRAFRGEL